MIAKPVEMSGAFSFFRNSLKDCCIISVLDTRRTVMCEKTQALMLSQKVIVTKLEDILGKP
jgi:hypothetical protein